MANLITFDQFVKNHIGKAVDYDGVAGVQCVDLAKCYLDEVFGIKAGAWGDAHAYYDNFYNVTPLVNNFARIANTPDFVPQKGDIAVWSSTLSSGGWGHIAVCTGEGDTTYFYSYDQNWTGNHDACAKIRHNYNHFAGVLRPKDQSRIKAVTSTTAASASPFTNGKNYTTTAPLRVRTGAGTQYTQKARAALTADGQKHAMNQIYACLNVGTVVTVLEVKKISAKEYWGRIPSGWICLMLDGIKYVK